VASKKFNLHTIDISPLHCDGQAIIVKANSKSFNEKKRHMIIRHKSVRHLISHGIISLDIVRSGNNMVDSLTKGLACKQVIQSSREMRLKPLNYSLTVETYL
jgi:hypothetical protein